MTDSESDSTADSPDGDGTVDCDPDRLETLTRDEPWGPEAFRDAGDATFRTR